MSSPWTRTAASLKTAMAYGTVVASLTVEGFGLDRLKQTKREEIETRLGLPLQDFRDAQVRAPGQLASHYAPRAALRLDANRAGPGEVLLGFGPHAPEDALNLSPAGNLREAAANLFAYLRALDAQGPQQIAVMPVPGDGLGEAINDRLRRASVPLSPDRRASVRLMGRRSGDKGTLEDS